MYLPRPIKLLVQAMAWLLFVVVLLRVAWVCDDAFITMRCVHNAVNGDGLTFNVMERVQAFTHPLWALLLVPMHAIFRSAYWELILLGSVSTMAALWVAGRSLRMAWAWWAIPLVCLGSKAFMEYATSGLENGLNYFLMALFMAQWWRGHQHRSGLLRLSLLAAIVMLNRMDLALMVAPPLAVAFWRERSWQALGQVLLGFMPFFIWEVFATIYYGFPFPNTAYAKLGNYISQTELWRMGFHYLLDSLERDWLTVPMIVLAAALGLWRRRDLPIVLGLVLYIVYVARIGGDFMTGRFLSVPFWVSVLLVARTFALRDWQIQWAVWAGAATLLGLLSPTPPMLSGADFHVPEEWLVATTGIADERAFYYPGTGLLNCWDKPQVPQHEWAAFGRLLGKGAADVRVMGAVGMAGYFSGPAQHIIDKFALADPFLARLPAVIKLRPRAGHFERRLPIGYEGSIITGRNRVEDAAVAGLYDQVRLVTSGPLFSGARWKAIWDMNVLPPNREAMLRYWVPIDNRYALERDSVFQLSVYHGGTSLLHFPKGCKRISFESESDIGCELFWMQGDLPLYGVRILEQGRFIFRRPFGADGMLLVREGDSRKCRIAKLRAE